VGFEQTVYSCSGKDCVVSVSFLQEEMGVYWKQSAGSLSSLSPIGPSNINRKIEKRKICGKARAVGFEADVFGVSSGTGE
jgi:hypothetical protein